MGTKLPTHLHFVPRFRVSRATHPLSYMPSWHAQAQPYLSHTKFSHKYFSTVHMMSCLWCDCGDTELQNLRFLPFSHQYYHYGCMQLASSMCCVNKVQHMPNTIQMEFYFQMLQVKPILFHVPLFCPPLPFVCRQKWWGKSVDSCVASFSCGNPKD
jgi:hypothetical protein